MSRFVVECPEHNILGGLIYESRRHAMLEAQSLLHAPWHVLAEQGYRIRELVSRSTPIAHRLLSLTIELPEDQMRRLECISARSGMTVRHLASVMVAGTLSGALRQGGEDD